jgi:hypothetical protein
MFLKDVISEFKKKIHTILVTFWFVSHFLVTIYF